jgi:mRNA-degrading endonuclease RelE of RelBE toxin-antitoxin system
MLIVETPVFTRRVLKLVSDENYRSLQQVLVADPETGNLIRHSGGLRKIRWSVTGRGKRGGVRIIYYWAPARETILMLLMYGKNEQDDLTAEQLRILKRLIEKEFA